MYAIVSSKRGRTDCATSSQTQRPDKGGHPNPPTLPKKATGSSGSSRNITSAASQRSFSTLLTCALRRASYAGELRERERRMGGYEQDFLFMAAALIHVCRHTPSRHSPSKLGVARSGLLLPSAALALREGQEGSKRIQDERITRIYYKI